MAKDFEPTPIPDNLKPIFEAKTAHEALRVAIGLVKISSPADQTALLRNDIFLAGFRSAVAGLDETPEVHKNEVLQAFSSENRDLADDTLF